MFVSFTSEHKIVFHLLSPAILYFGLIDEKPGSSKTNLELSDPESLNFRQRHDFR
jgi:hypothetical protein